MISLYLYQNIPDCSRLSLLSTSISLYLSSSCPTSADFFGTYTSGSTSLLGVLSADPSGFVMATSEQARNSSWGPHPTAPVPFLHSPTKHLKI